MAKKRKSRKKARKGLGAGRVFAIVGLLVVLGVGFLAWETLAPYGHSSEVFVDVAPHTGTVAIARQLAHAGVIRSWWAFAAMRELEGGSLKAGEYQFAGPSSLVDVYRKLRRGEVYTVAVVIPEGYNLFEIAGAVQGAGLGSQEAFLAAAAANVSLASAWSPHAPSLEGYLFPDTYRFSRHTTPAMMLQVMTRRFGQVALRLGLAGPAVNRTVTLASLVEREVHVEGERPLVAGVFENRLRLGMPLQTDPAVAYASMLRGTWTGVIHQSELHSDSPYNTYVHAGLPPGPICNPGLASLRAAMHPASTDFLYFVANADGSTHFARDLREHAANVQAYRKGLAGPH